MSESPIVRLEDVTFAYDGRPAVEDVSLTVEDGEFLGLVGPNGSGKTTLLKLMLGLVAPDAGRVELFGEPVDAFDDGERLGYVSQHSTGAERTMPITVREVVTMGRYPHTRFGRLGRHDREMVQQALERVEIAELSDRRINELSGGQKQRAFIARTLAGEADLLALDEPTVGVDADSRDAFYTLLDELTDRGITVVLIEHDIGVVTDHADRIACINRELYHHGDPAGFVESDALARAYGTNSRLIEHGH
ncbi:metal ABC transporter ATP-binding protein [Halalkalicoccus jeotgali]|uniref:Cobalamin import ATP-binding protein BtuD n=1 Tax=Halalkalicoccus jeotgali (strain DSM 18796 / CECT 7217 / JCM 14584 / KCTC 4019 / B3) TaxID=795797 RepID=D8J3I2_HALJB|nr:metal ABC transporter ATP-binding protein [Halalkalicoccus jeotgali]ADJ15289.1 ABC transporter related protein [Halalkalicoccus jeotgali B3]ELY35498.1 ABC transporter-like protein [Halalkalicoccus jeotgali B3]